MFRKVLVGYDGYPAAKDALVLAQRLVAQENGELTLVCTYPYDPYAPHTDGGTYTETLRKRADEALAEGRELVRDDITVHTIAAPATSTSEGLSKTAEEGHFDLLVLGSTHHGPVGRVVLGSTDERLVHSAPCAVAIAPRELTTTTQFQHIGVGYDGSPESTAALTAAFKLATERRASVYTYTVEEIPLITTMPGAEFAYAAREDLAHEAAEESVSKVRELAPEGLELHTILLTGRTEDVIIEQAHKKIDLLIVGSRRYGAFKRAFLGSVSTGIIRSHVPFPLLIVPRGTHPS